MFFFFPERECRSVYFTSFLSFFFFPASHLSVYRHSLLSVLSPVPYEKQLPNLEDKKKKKKNHRKPFSRSFLPKRLREQSSVYKCVCVCVLRILFYKRYISIYLYIYSFVNSRHPSSVSVHDLRSFSENLCFESCLSSGLLCGVTSPAEGTKKSVLKLFMHSIFI